MATTSEETLEILLNKATSPLNRDDDEDCLTSFANKVNSEIDGATTSTRLLAHKIQSPQEHESLQALIVLEHCAKNCGESFQNEIGKYRFLNELIKVVSPKYLGHKTTEKVRNKVIQLLFVWSIGLTNQIKIRDAYQMLKVQGIVKNDPDYDDTMLIPTPTPRDNTNDLFKSEERQKRLEKLLKSKNPEDLQAANRLIKSVVMEDQNRMEKIQKRCKILEEVSNNVRLLNEMLSHYDVNTVKQTEDETMKELHSGCLKLRPGLFRLASDTDDDEQALMDILKANDDLSRVIQSYEKLVIPKLSATDRKGDRQEASGPNETAATGKPKSSLIDLAGIEMNSKAPPSDLNDSNLLFVDLQRPNTTNGGNDLFDLHTEVAKTSTSDFSELFGTMSVTSQSTMPTSFMMSQQPGSQPTTIKKKPTNTVPPLLPPPPSNNIAKDSFSEIDQISRNLLERSLGRKPEEKFAAKAQTRPTLNQLSSKQIQPSDNVLATQNDLLNDIFSPLSPGTFQENTKTDPFSDFLSSSLPDLSDTLVTETSVTTQSQVTSQNLITTTPTATTPLPLSLSDVFVPLESIKPSTLSPLTLYDRNGLRVFLHFAQDFASPNRTDTLVSIVSIMSTRTTPVPNIILQLAVPKTMRVKLQPPSSTQLAAFNPLAPTAPIAQVMVLANPNKKEVKIRFKLDYKLDDQTSISETGEISGFPAFEQWGSL